MTSAVDSATIAQDQAQLTQALSRRLPRPCARPCCARRWRHGDRGQRERREHVGGGFRLDSLERLQLDTLREQFDELVGFVSSGVVTIANLAKGIAGLAEADATKIKVGQNAT